MVLREQLAVHTLRAHRPDVQTQTASRQRAGTSSGIHPEDSPYQTDERRRTNRQRVYDDGEDDDAIYNTRLPTSARRYAPTPARTPHTVMRVTRHQGLPPKQRAPDTQAPAYHQPEQAPVFRHRPPRLHVSVYIGIGMAVMVLGWIALSSLAGWWQFQQDTWNYGTPRTFQVDADVRHGGSSHFTVENIQGHIFIYEVQLANPTKPHLYLGPIFSGAGAETQPATISFEDLNGDGYPDMVIAVGTGRYPLINDHSAFRSVNASDHLISATGV